MTRLALAALVALAFAHPAAAQEDARPLEPSASAEPEGRTAAPRRSRLLPVPTLQGPEAAGENGGSTAAAAFAAFQRGRYLSALQIAEPLANMGDAAAQSLVGEIYLRGLGVPQDSEEAARWLRVAAEADAPQAQFQYAMMLIDGEGVAADPDAARELMRDAADAGHPLAAFNYGQMLIRAQPTGGFAEARPYFERAAEFGVPDGQYALAQLYANGLGGAEQDDAAARRWLHAAAVKGHDTAQIELGIWLINGRGGPADAPGGFRWLKGAAEGGNPIAINRVAHLYREGIGTLRDTGEAAMWAVLARRAGNADPALDQFLRDLTEGEQREALEAANRFQAE